MTPLRGALDAEAPNGKARSVFRQRPGSVHGAHHQNSPSMGSMEGEGAALMVEVTEEEDEVGNGFLGDSGTEDPWANLSQRNVVRERPKPVSEGHSNEAEVGEGRC